MEGVILSEAALQAERKPALGEAEGISREEGSNRCSPRPQLSLHDSPVKNFSL